MKMAQGTGPGKDPITLSEGELGISFDRRPVTLRHQLDDHPYFELESLVALAKRLPKHHCEYMFGKHAFGSHDNEAVYRHASPTDSMSTEELIRQVECGETIIVLRNVEIDDQYAKLIHGCLDSIEEFVSPLCGDMLQRESFIFISPPNAYTPFHYDPEQNFFFQIRGRKEMAIFDKLDRNLVSERDLEAFYGENQKICEFKEDYHHRGNVFHLGPGDGVYVPLTAPHWVKTMDEISISFSVTFRTVETIRRERIYRFNHMLRRLGFNPTPVSEDLSGLMDRTKASIWAMAARMAGKPVRY